MDLGDLAEWREELNWRAGGADSELDMVQLTFRLSPQLEADTISLVMGSQLDY